MGIIHNYSVNKYYGHFWQCYRIKADSKEDAWDRAEKDGFLEYQQVYREEKDLDSPGYVVDLDEKVKEESPISEEQYYEWMREAIEKGMCVTQKEYEKSLGLPFTDVWY